MTPPDWTVPLPPRRTPMAVWRALPLTAQLAIVGLIVAVAWFLIARLATDRQEAGQRARNEAVVQLHRAELLTTRLGTAMAMMSSAQRGFVLTGSEDLLRPLEQWRRVFLTDREVLLERTAIDPGLKTDVRQLAEQLAFWHDSIVLPNLALRRSAGLSAFTEGTPGAARLLRGAARIDQARVLHTQMLRRIRDQLRDAEVEAERAASLDELESFLIRAAAVAVFLLLGTLLLRLVARALAQVVTAAHALETGRYAEARLPDSHRAPNREMAMLAHTFDRVAESIATRERQLQEDIVKLRELDRLKADFVSTVSHELRTPLTSMRGALGLILGGKVGELPGRGRELLQIAMTNTERLIRLINDILDIEKMDAGHVSIRRERLRLRPVVETTMAGLEGFARDAKVTLRLLTDADAEVLGDPDRLVQVLTNLASNAVKFSPAGSAVELSVVPAEATVSVLVRDHGPGIPEEFAERIFGRFQQAGGADSRRSGGTGLGLNIAKAIVELHEGRIGFEPAAGGGTTFWITLPIVAPAAHAPDARLAVLVIEDDAAMRDILVAQVEAHARPIAVQSAEAALEVLERETVAAIICDPGLPGMSGVEFARRLRGDDRFKRLPIFLFSAREHSAEELRSAGIRASDAYVKTRDSEEVLFARLSAELRRPR